MLTTPCGILLASAVRFEQPWWLLLSLAAAGPVLVALAARRHGRCVPAGNTVLQCLAVLAAAAALARPAAPVGAGARRPLLVLRDVSNSCRRQRDRAVALGEDLPAELYDFASAVVPAAPDGRPARAADANQTCLAAGLRLAAARRDELAGLILQTDGRFTDTEWRAAAGRLGQTKLPVCVLPMLSPPADAQIADLAAARSTDGRVHLRVAVRSNALQRRTVVVLRRGRPDGEELLRRRLDLLGGQGALLRLTDAAAPRGEAVVYTARLIPPDAFPENDAAEAVVLPASRRVAIAGDGAIDGAALAAELGLPVERVGPAGAPPRADAWLAYAAVVLMDAAGTRVGPAGRAALEEYVRSGGGLVLVGAGPHASPDDRDDPLNRAAALVANPYQRRPIRLVVVLDASGSMAEPAGPTRVKFHQAVEAVTGLRRHLTGADALSVITFSDSARVAYDSGEKAIDFAAVAEALGRVRPAGPTDVWEALARAAATPAGTGRDGLVLVVSDLMTKPFRADRAAAMLREQKHSLAVVVIAGGQASQPGSAPLLQLAGLLGSPVVRRGSLAGLTEVFASLLRRTRGRAVRRGRFEAAAVRAAFGTPPGPLPDVRAYLLCAPQREAEVLARVGGAGDALLACRRVGLGRSVSLALHPGRGQNPEWQAAGRLVRLAGAAARWALRPGGDARFTGRLRRGPGGLHVLVDAEDANTPLNLLSLTGRIVSHDPAAGDAGPFRLTQTAPGRYEAHAAAPSAPASLSVSLPEGSPVWQTALARAAPGELAAVGADWANLRALAELTGGRIVREAELADLRERLLADRSSDLWPVLLAAAAVLMLAEWATARVWHRRA